MCNMWVEICLTLMLYWRYFVQSSGTVEDGCLTLLPDDYKKLESPFELGKPGNISFSFSLYDLDEISEANMDFRIHGFLLLSWHDNRLNTYNKEVESSECMKYIWYPNLVFLNAKKVEEFPKNTVFLINGTQILASKRYSFRNSCRMNFMDYPFDTQKCEVDIATMFIDDRFVNLQWHASDGKPIKVKSLIEPLQFHFMEPIGSSYPRIVYETKKKKHLVIKLTLVRRLMGSIINIYLPSTLIVSVSWITFWLKLTATPARVSLSITSLLTLFTQVQKTKDNLPPLTYITAVDIWGFVCIFMVFGTLVEFAICYNAFRDEDAKLNQSREASALKLTTWSTATNENKENASESSRPSSKMGNYAKCFGLLSVTNKLDALCRKLFPGSFLVFSTVYWAYYLTRYYNAQESA